MKTLKTIELAGRIVAGLSIAFLIFFIGAHLLELNEVSTGFNSGKEIFLFACFPLTTLIGLCYGFRNAYIGGLMILFSMLIFFMLSPNSTREPIFYLGFLLPGLLFLISGLIKRNKY